MILHHSEIVVLYGWELTDQYILDLADNVERWADADPDEIKGLDKKKSSRKRKQNTDDSADDRYERTMELLIELRENRDTINTAFQRVIGIILDEVVFAFMRRYIEPDELLHSAGSPGLIT